LTSAFSGTRAQISNSISKKIVKRVDDVAAAQSSIYRHVAELCAVTDLHPTDSSLSEAMRRAMASRADWDAAEVPLQVLLCGPSQRSLHPLMSPRAEVPKKEEPRGAKANAQWAALYGEDPQEKWDRLAVPEQRAEVGAGAAEPASKKPSKPTLSINPRLSPKGSMTIEEIFNRL
jgi:hypothetical protein